MWINYGNGAIHLSKREKQTLLSLHELDVPLSAWELAKYWAGRRSVLLVDHLEAREALINLSKRCFVKLNSSELAYELTVKGFSLVRQICENTRRCAGP